MTIPKIKEELKNFTDLYGNKLLDYHEINSCKTLFDIENIIEKHREHVHECIKDVDSHLDNFKRKLGI
jgi:uncharacterized protein with von Willebrand factor type A (vWA) domain